MGKNFRNEESFYMKEMEWGVNSKTNTTYMNYEFDIDSLYSTIVKLDYLQRVNPNTSMFLSNLRSAFTAIWCNCEKGTCLSITKERSRRTSGNFDISFRVNFSAVAN